MQMIFDLVVIGAGPAAVSALAGIPTRMKIAIATGEKAANAKLSSNIHPKIRTVALEKGEQPGIARLLPFKESSNGALFDTAVQGGLARYWGQQVIHYECCDPWPKEFFASYDEYLQACSQIEKFFLCLPDIDCRKSQSLSSGYEAYLPRLLLGTKRDPEAGLLSMGLVFQQLAEKHNATLYRDSVSQLKLHNRYISVLLSDGTVLTARRVILAAGVVGSLRIVMESNPEIRSIRLSDHAPYMYYFVDRAGLVKHAQLNSLQHFNCLSIERIECQQVRLFASLYRMSRATVALTLAALGFPPILLHTRPPKIVDLIIPIQVWTNKSKMQYQIDRNDSFTTLISRPDFESDKELYCFSDWLKSKGIIICKSNTIPGYGFHYHAGEISLDGENFSELSSFISEKYRNKIICTDASIMRKIGIRPHTLTAMAISYKITCLQIS